jgi:hypothetical protein
VADLGLCLAGHVPQHEPTDRPWNWCQVRAYFWSAATCFVNDLTRLHSFGGVLKYSEWTSFKNSPQVYLSPDGYRPRVASTKVVYESGPDQWCRRVVAE